MPIRCPKPFTNAALFVSGVSGVLLCGAIACSSTTTGTGTGTGGKGLFGGLGTPLLIGGGLLGIFLLTRSRERRGDES